MGRLRRIVARLFGRRPPAMPAAQVKQSFVVSFADGEISSLRPDGTSEHVRLADLRAVLIETNDRGPAEADVWWLLVGEDATGCVFPQGATGEDAIVRTLLELPGFDHAAMTTAMASTANRRFLCWQRTATQPTRGGLG